MTRLLAIAYKEFVHVRRDRLTFVMLIGITVMYLILFGFAINPDPKNQPLVIVERDSGPFTRRLVASLEASGYFRMAAHIDDPEQATALLRQGFSRFVLEVPAEFSRDLQRGLKPSLLLEADGTDPMAVEHSLQVFAEVANSVFISELQGASSPVQARDALVDLRILRRYNPEAIAQYNIVPGLLGVILTMTMVLMTGLAVTRERERGTMEFLLSTPVKPAEVLFGKIIPYLVIGFFQSAFIYVLARVVFAVPTEGSQLLLFFCLFAFISANLALGVTISTVARNQLQAMQMTFFFFLPSILLSGFMFPYSGMPRWAQIIAEVLPLTHFQRLSRGLMLKGTSWLETWPHLWPILLFMVVIITLGIIRYRRTLD
jgi:ABC-2 type transport system permease protein